MGWSARGAGLHCGVCISGRGGFSRYVATGRRRGLSVAAGRRENPARAEAEEAAASTACMTCQQQQGGTSGISASAAAPAMCIHGRECVCLRWRDGPLQGGVRRASGLAASAAG